MLSTLKIKKNGMEQILFSYIVYKTMYLKKKAIYKCYNTDLCHNLLGLPKTSSTIKDNYFIERKSNQLYLNFF